LKAELLRIQTTHAREAALLKFLQQHPGCGVPTPSQALVGPKPPAMDPKMQPNMTQPPVSSTSATTPAPRSSRIRQQSPICEGNSSAEFDGLSAVRAGKRRCI
jgi:hypothetical protein